MTISAKHNPLIRKTGILPSARIYPFYQYFLTCGITPAGWSPDAWRWLVMVVGKGYAYQLLLLLDEVVCGGSWRGRLAVVVFLGGIWWCWLVVVVVKMVVRGAG